MTDITYFGWSDPDKRRSIGDKIVDAADAYRAKHNLPLKTTLTVHIHPSNLDSTAAPANIIVETAHFVPRNTIYVSAPPPTEEAP